MQEPENFHRAVPAPQPKIKGTVKSPSLPYWLLPIAFKISNGHEDGGAENALGFSEDGNLLLYRRLSRSSDWEHFPPLIGVEEVWIELFLPDAGN